MKKLTLLTITIYISCFIKAQQANLTLNTNQSSLMQGGTNVTESARDQVTLGAGFSLTNSSVYTFTVNTDHTIIPTTPGYATGSNILTSSRPLDTTSCAPGSIGGIITVGPTGGATSSIPIQVAPGSHGMQPGLSIVYSSQSSNDILGYGWHLNGLSTISRVPKNPYYDGTTAPVTLTNDYSGRPLDALSLDGQRLVQVGNSSYSPENDPYTIVDLDVNQNVFTLTTKDGTTVTYGDNTDGNLSKFYPYMKSVPYSWAITKITDPDHNYTEYFYNTKGTGEYWISEIRYTGNGSTAPFNTVNFYYNNRTDANISYIDNAGDGINETLLLTSIKVFAEKALAYDYGFTYYYDGKYSKLNQVSLTANGTKYNPTVINWGNAPDYVVAKSDPGLGSNENYYLYYGDFNGDGITDVAQYEPLGKGLTINYGAPGGGWSGVQYNALINLPNMEYGGKIVDRKSISVADWNNDGKDDIMLNYVSHYSTTSGSTTTYYESDYAYYYSAGIAATQINSITSSSTSNSPDNNYQYFYGDFNNDGIMDMIRMLHGSYDYCTLGVSPAPSIIGNQLFSIDFDGDGETEILALGNNYAGTIWKYNGSTFVSLYSSSFALPDGIFLGDFNGDGKTDYLSYNGGSWNVYYSTGSSFTQGSLLSGVHAPDPSLLGQQANGTCYNMASIAAVADLNNDGKSDIIFAYAGSCSSDCNVYVYMSQGTSFSLAKTFDVSSVPTCEMDRISLTAADLNGDGQKEIIFGEDNYERLDGLQDVKENFQKWTFNSRLDSSLYVNSINDGNNNISAVAYSAYHDQVSAELTYPVRRFRGPMHYAKEVRTYKGSNTWSDITYGFSDAKMHMQGKGFLGFMNTTTSDAVSKVSSANAYYTCFNGIYSPGTFYIALDSTTIWKNNNLVSTVRNSGMNYYGGNLAQHLFFPQMSVTTSKNFLTGFTTTNNIVSFNATIGRATDQKSFTSDGWTIETKPSYLVVSGNETKPSQVITTKTLGGDTYTSTATFTYGNTTYPFRITSTTAQGLVTTNNTSFDNYGNVTGTTMHVTDGTPDRTTSCSYDLYGRYIVSSTDVTQLKSLATYSGTNGALLSQTDPNGLVVSYDYSTGGNASVVTKNIPDGNIVKNKTGWDASGTGLYYTQQSVTNGNTVTDYYNAAGWKVKETSYGFNGALMTTIWTYNSNGTVSQITPPGLSSNPENYTYDDYGRVLTDVGLNRNLKYSYSGASTTVTDKNIAPNMTKATTVDALGNVTNVNASTGDVIYTYYGSGKVHSITTGGSTTTMTYDPLTLYQDTLIDPDAGTTTYTYNGFGDLLTQKDANGNTTSCTYDNYGRQASKSGTGLSVAYSYSATPGTQGLLSSVTRTNGNGVVGKSYTYDALCRTLAITTSGPVTPGGATTNFITSYTYNAAGQTSKISYPSGLSVNYVYDGVGNLKQINNASGAKIWSGDAQNALGMWGQYSLGNNLVTKWVYDSKYMLSSIQTGTSSNPTSVQNLGFTFNPSGQLTNRTSGSLSETFTYDGMDRLTSSQVGSGTKFNYYYQATGQIDNGNIYSTTLSGTYSYNSTHPHAVASTSGVSPNSGQSPALNTTNTYNIENKVLTIDNGTNHDDFVYSVDGNRFRVDYKTSGSLQSSKVYIDNNEFGYNATGSIIYKRTFINSPTGICALYQDSGNMKTFYYIHSDYQGSWLAITDTTGSLKQQYSYDAWGRPRDPLTWQLKTIGASTYATDLAGMQPRFDRGYTGHEMMAGFALINMNGRLYDPYLQRFLSPDDEVQFPDNSQSFNRYTYCLNNPIIYTDPTGNSIFGFGGDFIIGFIKGFFNNKGSGRTMLGNAFHEGFREADNGGKIDMELGKTILTGEIFTQTPQIIVGYFAADFTNNVKYGVKTSFFDGALVMENCWSGGSFTLGPYIQLGNYTSMYENYTNPMTGNEQSVFSLEFIHEYGHYMQSKASGWFYLPKYGIPSFLKPGNDAWMEYDASLRGYNHFNAYHNNQMRLFPKTTRSGDLTITTYDNWDDNEFKRATKITNPDWGDFWRMTIPSVTLGGLGDIIGWILIINKNKHM